MNDVTCSGRFPGNASSDASGGNSPSRPGTQTWNTRSGWREITQAVLTQIDERDRIIRTVTDESGSRLRTHHLTAMRRRDISRAARFTAVP